MIEVNIHEAKTHLSKLLARVALGEEVVIARAGEPVAKLVRIGQPQRRTAGTDRGKIWIALDFDAPLDPETFEPCDSSSTPTAGSGGTRARRSSLRKRTSASRTSRMK